MNDFEIRFGGIARLYGAIGMERLRTAHVCAVGLGGVGSWAVEALARSGLGRLTLVDLDEICASNVNRQLHALNGAVGRPKVEVMAERVRAISPECVVRPRMEFFTAQNADDIFREGYDAVLDAIDSVADKCRLIALCRSRGIHLVTCGSAGGRRDATMVRVADLAFTSHDRLLLRVRDELRKLHGFPPARMALGIPCVYSAEPPVFPRKDGSVGPRREAGSAVRLDCDTGLGTATFVTGAFGFVAAGLVVKKITEGPDIIDQAGRKAGSNKPID
jgi:tRNA A37 threonylcarbamoyladenosine dehydratase